MAKPLKVATIVGTRPELIKLSRVIAELDRRTEHVLIHTGQNYDYELNDIFFDQLDIRRPDHYLEAAGESAADTIGQVISRSHRVLVEEVPEAVLLLGDTNSCLAAVAAKRLQIPIFHMEAGNRSFDQRIPEEVNRKIVDHISDINLPYGEHARRHLLAEGLDSARIITTGSPLREVLDYYLPLIERSEILHKLGLTVGDYFVVSCHREDNVDFPERLRRLRAVLELVSERFGKPIVFSTHPRTRQRLAELQGLESPSWLGVRFLKPLGFLDYIKLQMHAFCVLSDSGSLTEEASLLSLPAVTIREAHERPEGMDEATLVMGGLGPERIVQAIELVTSHHSAERRSKVVTDYGADNVSFKVVRIILSYVDYVNQRVWRKPI